MGKVKTWFSELSDIKLVLIFFVVVSVISWGASEIFGKKYEKFYANNHSCSWAVSQFKSICGNTMSNDDGGGIEYYKFYDNRSQAINDFMTLARMLDGKYANGKFRHIYVPRKERIYQCWDKDRRLIALHFVKHRAGFYFGSWEKAIYEIEFYVER